MLIRIICIDCALTRKKNGHQHNISDTKVNVLHIS